MGFINAPQYIFRPYRGNDVASQEYVRLNFGRFGLGRCWVTATKSTLSEKKWTGDEYILNILGHGESPVIHWGQLTHDEKKKLRE